MTAGTKTVQAMGNVLIYTNSGTADNDVLILTDDVSRYDTFHVMSTAGTVDVFASLDGTNFATAALSLQDQGAIVSDPVLVTAANRIYGFRGKYRKVKVLVNGATNPTACSLVCGNMGG
jgi:hypothetical protein